MNQNPVIGGLQGPVIGGNTNNPSIGGLTAPAIGANTLYQALTPDEWGKIGGFVLLLIGLYFFSPPLALFVGGGAILIIVIRGLIP